MLLDTVTGPNTKLKAYFIFCRSAEIEHPIQFSISGRSKFSEARKVAGKTGKEVTSYEGKGSFLTKDLITCFAKWCWCFL